jgi:hypothetical protein
MAGSFRIAADEHIVAIGRQGVPQAFVGIQGGAMLVKIGQLHLSVAKNKAAVGFNSPINSLRKVDLPDPFANADTVAA